LACSCCAPPPPRSLLPSAAMYCTVFVNKIYIYSQADDEPHTLKTWKVLKEARFQTFEELPVSNYFYKNKTVVGLSYGIRRAGNSCVGGDQA
jgi:hypothetical protein